MRKIFEEYGGVITVAVAIVALIGIVAMLIGGPNGGLMGGAFERLVTDFEDKASAKIAGGSGSIDSEDEPVLNEYGFYYNQPYSANVDYLGGGKYYLYVREDKNYCLMDEGMIVANGICQIEGDTLSISVDMEGPMTFTFTISSDGTELYCNELSESFLLEKYAIVFDDDYIYFYDNSLNGYVVRCIESGKTKYGPIKGSINGTPTVMLKNSMFAGNQNLIQVPAIPDSVEIIGESAFYDCDGLTTITIPSSVKTIARQAFVGCDNLTSATIMGGSIGDKAFAGCYNLTSLTLAEGVTAIGSEAFLKCKITNLTVPSSVETIGASAFSECSNLSNLTIKNGVTSIGNNAFYRCSNLTSATLPNSIAAVGDNAFYYCEKLNTTIPNNIVTIGSSAFAGCNLTTVIIPASVTSFGEAAFYDCNNLTSITLSEGITYISAQAFNECDSLTSVIIPSSVETIGALAFSECSNLSNLTIKNGVTAIGSEAFSSCKLTSVTIPVSVTSIGDYAFNDNNLPSVSFNGTKEQWNAISFGDRFGIGSNVTQVVCSNGTISLD